MLTQLDYRSYLRFFGFYKESYKIIVGWKKIFSQITLTLIFPLSFIFLIHIQVSNILFKEILTIFGWVTFWLFNFLYFTFLLSFSLLPTSAVVYTVVSVYTAKDVTFIRVMRAVPKVWKKLMETLFLSAMLDFFTYSIIALHVFVIWELTIGRLGNFGFNFSVQFMAGYVFWLVHLAVIWEMENVVMTVLDLELGDLYRIGDAMMKNRVPEFIVLKLNVPLFVIPYFFVEMVVQGWRMGSVSGDKATVYVILYFLLLSLFFLFGFVMQTVLYFVYKQHRDQDIEDSASSDHLEAYQGEYTPLNAEDVQLEHSQDAHCSVPSVSTSNFQIKSDDSCAQVVAKDLLSDFTIVDVDKEIDHSVHNTIDLNIDGVEITPAKRS